MLEFVIFTNFLMVRLCGHNILVCMRHIYYYNVAGRFQKRQVKQTLINDQQNGEDEHA